MPLQISSYLRDVPVMNEWIDGFRGEKTIHLDRRASQVRLYESMPVVNKSWKDNACPKNFIPNIYIIPKVESYTHNQMSITPFLGKNAGDGIMPGLVFTQGLFPQYKFKWIAAPCTGWKAKKSGDTQKED